MYSTQKAATHTPCVCVCRVCVSCVCVCVCVQCKHISNFLYLFLSKLQANAIHSSSQPQNCKSRLPHKHSLTTTKISTSNYIKGHNSLTKSLTRHTELVLHQTSLINTIMYHLFFILWTTYNYRITYLLYHVPTRQSCIDMMPLSHFAVDSVKTTQN